ncbi:MAG: PA2779 family protein [Thiohalomonadaceae bacterium]
MYQPRKITRALCVFIAASLTGTAVPAGVANAAMIGTPAILSEQQMSVQRDQLLDVLERAEVQQKLAELGVDPQQAKARVAALTDEEIQTLNARMAEMPAGGIDALGAVVLVFLVLLITDIAGFTDVFPFVKSRR